MQIKINLKIFIFIILFILTKQIELYGVLMIFGIIHELAHIELSQLNQIDKDLFKFKINKYEDEADRYIKYILESI